MNKQKSNRLKKRLGDMLVDVGLITSEQLATALARQQKTGEKLGKIFLDMGVITRELLLAFLGKQCGVSYISLNEFGQISPEALRCIPEHVARRQLLIPVEREGEDIIVAMADPFNIFAVDDLKLLTGENINVVIASEQEIIQAIEQYYNRKSLPGEIPADFKVVGPDREIPGWLKPVIVQGIRLSAISAHLEKDVVRYRQGGWLSPYVLKEWPVFSQLRNIALQTIIVTLGERTYAVEVNLYPERVLLKFRNISPGYDNLNNLGFSEEFLAIYRKFLLWRRGLIIIAGPENSGKSTTIQATGNYLRYPDRNLVHDEKNNFREADVIISDEKIPQDVIRQLINLSLSNKLVIMTWEAETPLGVIAGLLDLGISRELLATALSAIVVQRIVRQNCPYCKISYEVPGEYLVRSLTGQSEPVPDYIGEIANEKLTLFRGNGCEKCGYSGYLGYLSLGKIIPVDEDIRKILIEPGKSSELLTIFSRKETSSLGQLCWERIRQGHTSIEEMILRE